MRYFARVIKHLEYIKPETKQEIANSDKKYIYVLKQMFHHTNGNIFKIFLYGNNFQNFFF